MIRAAIYMWLLLLVCSVGVVQYDKFNLDLPSLEIVLLMGALAGLVAAPILFVGGIIQHLRK